MDRTGGRLYFLREFMDLLYMGTDWFNKEEYIRECLDSYLQDKGEITPVDGLIKKGYDPLHILWLLYNDLVVLADQASFSSIQEAFDWLKKLVNSLNLDAARYYSIMKSLRKDVDLLENSSLLDFKAIIEGCIACNQSLNELASHIEIRMGELIGQFGAEHLMALDIKEHPFWIDNSKEALEYLQSQEGHHTYQDVEESVGCIAEFIMLLYPSIWEGSAKQLRTTLANHLLKKHETDPLMYIP